MKQSTIYIKWFCRALLLLLLGSMGYIASRPEYNFAHWIPHGFLRDIGRHSMGRAACWLCIAFWRRITPSVAVVSRQSAHNREICISRLNQCR